MKPGPANQAERAGQAGSASQAERTSQAGLSSQGEPSKTLPKADPHIAEQRNRPTAPQADPGSSASPADAAEATEKADADKEGKSLSRLAAYKAEVAELLGGDSAARRRRKNTTPSGLPAPDPATQEPPIKLTRPPRKGGSRSKD